ncbi:Lipopolysaccharide-modifying protein [Ascosphaera apis ARSEF 7405]|uniref:Lipopolysaccharide-modifying protein n=1 Tax=Ascosphaera apis ARSEF 7405 TaxID=392613 RepID=A0A167YH52_9EURO|nr:Lipopolysaccharide-modifying protein [Ascosphaera apis ARSEF 7405]
MRSRQFFLVGILALIFLSIWFIQTNRDRLDIGLPPFKPRVDSDEQRKQDRPEVVPPASEFPLEGPLGGTSDSDHPIEQLIKQSANKFNQRKEKQSKTLKDAVEEYQRRYSMPPPPHFDVWFRLAKEKNVRIIDDYDTIYHSLLPFWGLKPSTIRERAREIISYRRQVTGMMIREKKITKCERRDEEKHWFPEALEGMTVNFLEWLPDMDLAFNINDEPRIVIPSDELNTLHQRGVQEIMKLAGETELKGFSSRPKDVNKGDRWYDANFKSFRFNRYDRQRTWEICRMSCPADSPARSIDDDVEDVTESYRFTDLGFVKNDTAHTDICLTPSLQRTFGLFERPNALDLSHVLMPMFSQSKISSFQDILYPSPWYWNNQVTYFEEQDREWDSKEDSLYWRGTTTGGFSKAGGWRRHHRQIFVGRVNGLTRANVLEPKPKEPEAAEQKSNAATTIEKRDDSSNNDTYWQISKRPRDDYRDLFNVKFTEIKHCDPDDCDAQQKYFEIANREQPSRAWSFRHLMDIDGHGFSGRFYSFLNSNSLPHKLAMFREWHNEWIAPWVHYIPLSHHGDEHVEVMRWLSRDKQGMLRARQLAQQGKDAARYARVIDDNRALLGYTLKE